MLRVVLRTGLFFLVVARFAGVRFRVERDGRFRTGGLLIDVLLLFVTFRAAIRGDLRGFWTRLRVFMYTGTCCVCCGLGDLIYLCKSLFTLAPASISFCA